MLDLVARALEVPLSSGQRPALAPAPRDAIVVLGAPLRPSGALSQILAERVVAAAALFHAGGGRHVVATGGRTRGAPRAEADAIVEALVAAGVPQAAVIAERASLTTADNARFTAAALAPLGARTCWLVTQPFHARRATLLFARAGLEPRAWHIADSVQYAERGRALRWLVREYAAWLKLSVRKR